MEGFIGLGRSKLPSVLPFSKKFKANKKERKEWREPWREGRLRRATAPYVRKG
jgi:hypothetical protein